MPEAHDTYVEWLSEENLAFAQAVEQDANALVPTCPGWNVRDLVVHHGSFQDWITTMLEHPFLRNRNPCSRSSVTSRMESGSGNTNLSLLLVPTNSSACHLNRQDRESASSTQPVLSLHASRG